ncbi:hypothetical protein B484DRAFT_414605, partial [Ochromonadaceae sp. CCMP2298]
MQLCLALWLLSGCEALRSVRFASFALHSVKTDSTLEKGWAPSWGGTSQNSVGASLRVRRLKDTALQKDILRDLTAGEFALSLEGNQQVRTEQIDFEGLVGRLDLALVALQRQPSLGGGDAVA